MHTQVNILHTGGNSLQQASSQADQSRKTAPDQANQPISQQEANPDIQGHLATAPGNMVELEALFIAEDPQEFTNERLMTAKWIQDDTQRDRAYLSIAQDCNVPTSKRIKAAELIQEGTQRDRAYLSIAQDPKVSSFCRLNAANLIQEGTQCDAAYLCIAQDPKVDPNNRLNAAKMIKAYPQRDAGYLCIAQDPKIDLDNRLRSIEAIQDDTQRDAAYLSLAQDITVTPFYRLKATKLIQSGIQRDTAYLSIAQDTQISINDRLAAARLIKDDTQRDAVYLCIAQDPTLEAIHYRLRAAELIINQRIQEEFYPSIIANILSIDAFRYMHAAITFVEGILDIQVKNLVITTLCQNWPLVKEEDLVQEEPLQNHFVAFRRLYDLASDDAKTDLITAIVTRTELDADFRKAVVEAYVQDPEERERLVKAIEEGQEASLNAPRTKRAR